jgi:hypothetical protein
LQRAAQAAEEAARSRIEKTKADQEHMRRSLEHQQAVLEAHAAAVEARNSEIEKVRLVINSALTSKISWHDIAEMVKVETEKKNPIASLIVKLNLEHDKVTLRLPNEMYSAPDNVDESSSSAVVAVTQELSINTKTRSSEKSRKKSGASSAAVSNEFRDVTRDPFIDVEIDLTQSAFNNARAIYADRAAARKKEEKVVASSKYVIKKVEDQVLKSLEQQKLKRTLAAARKVLWFEKFNWFISSEGYLVISGKDDLQSEAIIKKHLRPGDIYVHADYSGAVPCVIRNKYHNAESKAAPARGISPFALQEAGSFVVCRSIAWSSKVVISPWWVSATDISKVSPQGEVLPVGVCSILNRKNFLPPTTLEMGFGVLFKVDDASAERHSKDRVDKLNDYDEETLSMLSEAADRYGLDMSSVGTPSYPPAPWRAAIAAAPPAAPVAGISSASAPLPPPSASGSSGKGSNRKDSSGSKSAPAAAAASGGVKGKGAGGPAVKSAKAADAAEEPTKLSKKKAATKKKNKKYADQDEEDFELAMQALGLRKAAQSTKEEQLKAKRSEAEIVKKQQTAGIALLNEDWDAVLAPLSSEMKDIFSDMVQVGEIRPGELDSFEISTLSSFPVNVQKDILADFRSELLQREIKNKTGYYPNYSMFVCLMVFCRISGWRTEALRENE